MNKLLSVLFLTTLFFTGKSQSPAPDANFPEPNNQVMAVVYDSTRNSVYLGGYFTIVGSSVRTRFASLDATTGALNTWNPAFDAAIIDFKIVGNYLYVVGTFTSAAGSPRNHMAKFDLNTKTLTSWNPAVINLFNTIEYYNGKIYVANNAGLIYRIDTANTAGIDWQPANNGYVSTLKIANGYLYAGGNYTTMDGQPRGNIAAFDLSANPPTLDLWAPDADNRVNSIEYYNGNIYASGFFTAIAGAARTNLAEITAAEYGPANVTLWDPSTANEVDRLKVKGNQLYFFDYPNPMREIYLPTHTATTWSVNFASNIAWGNHGFDMSATKAFIGGGWNISYQGLAHKNFGVVCAAPYSPIIVQLNIVNGPSNICHGTTNAPYQVNTGTGATSYTWTSSPTATITTFPDSAKIHFPVNGTTSQYTVSVTGSNGCMSTNTASATVGTYTLSSSISAQFLNLICGAKDTITVGGNNYSGPGTISYAWSPASSLNTSSGDTVVSSAKNDATYTLTTTSSDGCVGKDTLSLVIAPFNVNVSHTSQTILCSTKDTMSLTNDYAGTGTLSYTWTPTTNLNLSNATSPIANPVTSMVYTLDASSSDGCLAVQQYIAVNVTPITVNAGSNLGGITCGNSANLSSSTDYPGNGTVTYTWVPSADLSNANIANPVASPTTATDYTLNITTPEGCQSSGSVFINVNALQVNTAGAYSTTCGNPLMLSTSNNSSNSNLTYSWSPASGLSSASSANPYANVGTTTIFTVIMSLPGSGCADAMAVDTVKIAAPAMPYICEVTSDSASQFNIVYWDKTGYQSTDSFIVYRETTTNTYSKIGTVAHTALSQFIDTTRSVGPANGDPNIGTYRYKIAVKDSCGNISAMSPWHNTVYFVDNHTGVFTWNLYAVENATTPVTQYDLMRDNANNGVWTIIGSVTGTQGTLNDPQYLTYQSIANWRVEAQGFNCTPTLRQSNNNATQGSVVKSKSNITNNRQIGIKTYRDVSLSVYPNPNNGKFTISVNGVKGSVVVKVISVLGAEVYSASVNSSDRIAVDLSNEMNGTYIVQIIGEQTTVTRRVIKN